MSRTQLEMSELDCGDLSMSKSDSNPVATSAHDLAPPAPRLHTRIQQYTREVMSVVLMPVHLRRTVLVALIVGTWLTAFNHGDELFRGDFGWILAGKICLDYLTPFVVSNLGLLAHQRH